MKLYRKTIPYVLMSASLAMNNDAASAQRIIPQETSTNKTMLANVSPNFGPLAFMPSVTTQLDNKAYNLCERFIQNVLETRKKIAPTRGTPKYRTTVLKELPNAPVWAHCLYGQYATLERTIKELGDTMRIIPTQASRACFSFIKIMTKTYSGKEFNQCVHSGRAFESDSAYNAALDNHMKRRKISDKTPTKIRDAAISEFKQNNFCIEQITPGAIVIVPRRNNPSLRHAVMFLGRGITNDNGDFVETPNGEWMFAGFNNEAIGEIFKTYNMGNVFIADIHKISRRMYENELSRLESLPNDKIIEYICRGTKTLPMYLQHMSRNALIQMLRNKYFGNFVLANGMLTPNARITNLMRQNTL